VTRQALGTDGILCKLAHLGRTAPKKPRPRPFFTILTPRIKSWSKIQLTRGLQAEAVSGWAVLVENLRGQQYLLAHDQEEPVERLVSRLPALLSLL
jgi:hypothetical protein